MKILLTGTTGYIAQRLLPVLVAQGHHVVCAVRDAKRFKMQALPAQQVDLIELDFLDAESLSIIPNDIDIAFYLIHSMSTHAGDFGDLEAQCAHNFRDAISKTNAKQVIYLSGIVNEAELSKHLHSRKNVEDIIAQGSYALTTLRAGIIVGSGSASFEIIRDLVEKLPIMITPRWLNTRCQPIAIRNVIDILSGVMLREETFGKTYDIGGPDILSYKQMLLTFAKIRKLRRRIFVVPVMTPRISSYWLYFVTSTSYSLAKHLVHSMKVEVICRPNDLSKMLNITWIDYETSIRLAFDKIEQNQILSSWKDAQSSDVLLQGISHYVKVPTMGCYTDKRIKKVDDIPSTLQKIWSIGGKGGWYYGNWLWEIRGIMDQLIGGVGMRRGRRDEQEIFPGEALDFWRVLYADKTEGRLLLYAEMKLPGEAWLEFFVDEKGMLHQTATFRPLGVWGRLYWYLVLPFHGFIFEGMSNALAITKKKITK
jgi:uncharacterized protein YbjT (DUF2867 family)